MPGKLWTEEEVQILKDNYEWNPRTYLLLPKRTIQAVNFKAFSLSLKAKGRGEFLTLYADYFDKWSEEMAWILGFFTADGNLFHKLYDNNTEQWYITFTQKDKEILETVAEKLGFPKDKIKKQWSEEYQTTVHHFTFTNKYMFLRLEELGLMPNKSLQLQKVNVPKKYFSHFLRGYFDGDGCFSWSTTPRQRTPRVSFTCGSRNFVKWLESRITRYYGLPGARIRQRRDTNTWSMIYRKDASLKLMKILYSEKEKSLFIETKYNNFINYLTYHGIDLSIYETPELDRLESSKI